MRTNLISEQAPRLPNQLSRKRNNRIAVTGMGGFSTQDARMNQSSDSMRSFDAPEDLYNARTYT
jgi:hypothetical protein